MTEREVICAKILTDILFAARYFFTMRYGRKFSMGSHHRRIAQALNDVLQGKTTRLIINLPPRYSKTELAVKAFIAAGLAINPKSRFIHLSGSDNLALDNSEEIKDMVKQDWYQKLFPYVCVKKDSSSKKKWYTTAGGGVYATSAAGQVTGFGAGMMSADEKDERELTEAVGEMTNCDTGNFAGAIIIDDPIKPDDAESVAKREKVNLRFETTIRSRTNSRSTPIIIIMQRLHRNDLCGYLMELEPQEWKVLSLPAIVKDANGAEQPLWEQKHTLAELKKIERSNRFVFQTQYMQNPVSLQGERLWCFAFDRQKNTGRIIYNPQHPVILSFDFNRNPMACSAWQHYDGVLYGIAAIAIENATTKTMCQEIDRRFPNASFLITGDVSGKSATTISHLDNFAIIKNYFRLSGSQMQYGGANPRLADSRYFVNAVFEQYPIILDAQGCAPLIFDLENVLSDDENKPVKTSRNNPAQRADQLDTMRYVLHRYFSNILKQSNESQQSQHQQSQPIRPYRITTAAAV